MRGRFPAIRRNKCSGSSPGGRPSLAPRSCRALLCRRFAAAGIARSTFCGPLGCGTDSPRPCKPTGARQLPAVTATLDSLLAGGYAVLCLSRIRRFGGSNLLKERGQALGVVYGLSKTCRLVSTSKPVNFLLECRFLNGRYEIKRCLRRRLAPAAPRHAADHPVIPKCGGFARGTLRMRPQTTVTQTADQPPEIQQRDQDCGERDEPAQPAHREIGEVPLRAPCRPQQGAMLPPHPPASLVKETPAAVSGILPQSTLVAGIVVDNPFAPKGRGRIHIELHARPTGPCRQVSRRSRIEADPTGTAEVSLNPRMGVTGAHHILAGEVVEFTPVKPRHNSRW